MQLGARSFRLPTVGLSRLGGASPGGGSSQHGGRAVPTESYVSAVFQALAVFRFFSFAMGAGLAFFINLGDDPPVRQAILIGVVGLYNMVRVLRRFNPAAYQVVVTGLSLGSDVLLGVTLVLLSDGLDSAFLIYSLAPVLTASLLMNQQAAMTAALVTGLSVAGAYVASGLGLGHFPWILEGNYLALAMMYVAVCLLTGYLPFLANLNWQRRVRSESMEVERSRLRREVHDNVAQTLAFLSLKIKRAEERASSSGGALTSHDAVEIASMVERAYLAVRDYIDESHDSNIAEPLATGLAIVTGQWSRDTGLPVQMSLTDADYDLPPRTKIQLLQIAREALANVAKHASPNHVWVEMDRGPKGITIKIKDDGQGFPSSQPKGHGLDIMRERSAAVGADLSVESSPGVGTEVVVSYSDGREDGDR